MVLHYGYTLFFPGDFISSKTNFPLPCSHRAVNSLGERERERETRDCHQQMRKEKNLIHWGGKLFGFFVVVFWWLGGGGGCCCGFLCVFVFVLFYKRWSCMSPQARLSLKHSTTFQ